MSEPCAIWKSPAYESGIGEHTYWYDSPRAGGRYDIVKSAKMLVENKLTDQQKAYLTTWLVDQHTAGNDRPLITNAEIDRISNSVPKTVQERRDRLLSAISDHTPRLGDVMKYRDGVVLASLNDVPRENPHWANRDALIAATESTNFKEVEQLISFASGQQLLTNTRGELSLTYAGYAHLENMQKRSTNSLQAFVAMWFNAEVAQAYDVGIEPAIREAGYEAMRIDRKEHNNKIDDEIIAEIRRSRFLIADFTCSMVNDSNGGIAIPRGGVYYEAGFAQGLGIPVIWMCREDHIEHVHFDTRQFNHITWNDPEELRYKLRNRIGAVLGDAP